MSGFFDASCKKCGKRYGWSGEYKDRPAACPKCGHKPQPVPQAPAAQAIIKPTVKHAAGSTDWELAIEQCESIISSIDDLPDRAYDFGESVGEKVRSILEWIEENHYVTSAQQEALDNMEAGVDRWLNY